MINFFSLIICTYERASSLKVLLKSIHHQSLYPNEILIIDGSNGDDTQLLLESLALENLKYFKVDDDNKGLTKQRNFGINRVSKSSEIICFLDDDTILEPLYFENLMTTYKIYPKAVAVGGYITNEVKWEKYNDHNLSLWFRYGNWVRKEPLRFRVRRKLNLLTNTAPGFVPTCSNGRSVSFFPPSGEVYPTELIMGGVSSFKKEVFSKIQFSTYFQGYGLYEDADFSIRVSKLGQCYINTNAKLEHHHAPSGRPNYFKYGKMVVRNGWYVWRVKNNSPSFKDKFNWNATVLLLIVLRFSNILSDNRKSALFESLGRINGYISLLFNKPKSY